MSQIKELKNSKENQVNLIDFIELILPNAKTKYYELFLRILNSSIHTKYEDKIADAKTALKTLFSEKNQYIDEMSYFNTIIISYLFDIIHDTNIDIEVLNKFVDYNERNLIPKNDVTTYKTFKDVHNQVIFAEMKLEEKNLEKQVVKIFEDDEWLVVKPLTLESSVKYGYGTKWCTAMEKDNTYFERYSKEGILIYFINKLNNEKVAVYKKIIEGSAELKKPEITFWNVVDKQIDSFGCGLPSYILDELRNHFEKHNVTNKQVLLLLNGESPKNVIGKYKLGEKLSRPQINRLSESDIHITKMVN